jgi:hypothetical protein
MPVKIPEKKIKELLKKLNEVAFSKKVTLKQLQSLCGSFTFLGTTYLGRPTNTLSIKLYITIRNPVI